MRKNWVGYAFISPWLAGFLVFTAVPFLVSIYLSFTRYDVVSSPVWVGDRVYLMDIAGLMHVVCEKLIG